MYKIEYFIIYKLNLIKILRVKKWITLWRKLSQLILTKNSNCIIEIDGGVNLKNGPLLVKAGANALVAGSFIFNSINPEETIAKLKKL